MLRRQLSVLFGFLLLAAGLGYGLVRLFALRTEKGDVYPAYSTLRADPLGAKALFDSLNEIPGLTASRNYQPLPRLKTTGPVGLVYLGLQHEARWEEKELPFFQTLIAGGSRAILAFQPVGAIDPVEERKAEEEKKKQEKEDEKRMTAEERKMVEKLKKLKEAGTKFSTVAQKWGFGFEVTRRLKKAKPPEFIAEAQPAASGLEASLPWHSELHFKNVNAPWKTLYAMNGEPVLIERPWGAGSIVLAADSYFLSNEGLRDTTRAPKLLAHLIGPRSALIFDEEHLGISEQSGVATLARKYRLHGLVGGLLLIAALFVWQNIVRFVPPQEDSLASASVVTGRGSREGFLTLLRRSVPAGDLLSRCVTEWRRAAAEPRAVERLRAVYDDSNPPRAKADVLTVYGAIVKALTDRRRSGIQ